MSELRRYLGRAKKTQRTAAAELGIQPAYLNQLLSGVRRPSLDLALLIEQWSEGAIPVSSWRTEGRECA